MKVGLLILNLRSEALRWKILSFMSEYVKHIYLLYCILNVKVSNVKYSVKISLQIVHVIFNTM